LPILRGVVMEFEVEHAEQKLRELINNNFNVCCEKCHSLNYTSYPTVVGFYWICRDCRWVWNSGFLGEGGMSDRYDYNTHCIERKPMVIFLMKLRRFKKQLLSTRRKEKG
jgi:hypothetical protein